MKRKKHTYGMNFISCFTASTNLNPVGQRQLVGHNPSDQRLAIR